MAEARTTSMLDDEVRSAVLRSHLAGVDERVLERLLDGSIRLEIPAGAVLHRPEDGTRLGLVVHGLLGVYMATPDGRQMTLRYCRNGSLMGVATLFSSIPNHLVQQAVVASRIVVMRDATARDLAAREPALALAFLQETSDRVQTYIEVAGGNVFSTIRQRVVSHLLDMAQPRAGSASELLVSQGQGQIADAAGTVREVVVRVLRSLREDGFIRTGRAGIVLLDPVRLAEETWSPDA